MGRSSAVQKDPRLRAAPLNGGKGKCTEVRSCNGIPPPNLQRTPTSSTCSGRKLAPASRKGAHTVLFLSRKAYVVYIVLPLQREDNLWGQAGVSAVGKETGLSLDGLNGHRGAAGTLCVSIHAPITRLSATWEKSSSWMLTSRALPELIF